MEALIIIPLAIGLYFLPGIVAHIRDHNNENPIVLLNLFLGWTFLGWVIALAWSASDNVATPTPAAAKPAKHDEDDPARIRCPHCAEMILLEANVCKHCGRDVFPSAEAFADAPNSPRG